MKGNLSDAIDRLRADKCSLVIMKNDEVLTYDRLQVSDLYQLLENSPECLRDTFVAGRIIDKATAALLMLGGVKEVFSEIISEPALRLLQNSEIVCKAGRLVPSVFDSLDEAESSAEKLIIKCESADECLPLIEDYLSR